MLTTGSSVRPANRIPAVAGILYILVVLVGVIFEFNGPDVLDTPAEVVANFTAKRTEVLAASTLFCIASVLYLVFLLGLTAVVRRAEAEREPTVPAAGFVVAAGVCSIVVLLGFIMIYGVLATRIVDFADGKTVLALFAVGNAFDALSSFFSGLVMVVSSLVFLRASAFGAWINWVGILGGACAIAAVVTFGTDGFWPVLGGMGAVSILLQILWTIAINVAILRRTTPVSTPAMTAAAP